MSTLMFWNKQNANANNQTNETKNGKKNWLHAPDALVNGHVAYLVKFLGATPVEQAKGIDTVKDAIRRLQFAQQIKKVEGNNLKTKKVEITISVDGVAVQEPRAQKVLHQFPLHDISYCADEKGVKKFFSFIAKTNNPVPNGDTTTIPTNNHTEESHKCFVFISSKLASDITLTIGQAFELAYRRYMTDGTKVTELSKLQIQNKQLENSVSVYRQRLKDLMELLPKSDLDRLLLRYGVRDMLEVTPLENGISNHVASINGSKTPDLGIDVSSPMNDDQLLIETSPKHFAPMVPPRNLQNQINSTLDAFKPSVGTKLEGLLLNSDSDSDFDPRADESDTSSTTNGGSNGGNKITNDLFGFEPPKTMGQQLFTTSSNGNHINNSSPINHSLSNGLTLVNGNGIGYQLSPPPLLAPPPKAAIPRRTAVQPNNNNNHIINNNSQDLFGSTPFNAMNSSPFDANSTVGGHSSFSNSFDNATDIYSSSTTAVSTCTNNNSSPFTVSTASTAKSFNNNNIIGNPFNESGISMNDSRNDSDDKNHISTSSAEFSEPLDFDKFDDVFKTETIDAADAANPFRNFNTSGLVGNGNTAPMAFTAPTTTSVMNNSRAFSPNPFAGKTSVHVGATTAPSITPTSTATSGNAINYDAFRYISMESATTATNTNTDKTPEKSNQSVAINVDLFKDAAAVAFKEFGKSTGTMSPKSFNKHEFSNHNNSNKEAPGCFDSFGIDCKNNFNKPMAFSADDFTLESLDPLRK